MTVTSPEIMLDKLGTRIICAYYTGLAFQNLFEINVVDKYC